MARVWTGLDYSDLCKVRYSSAERLWVYDCSFTCVGFGSSTAACPAADQATEVYCAGYEGAAGTFGYGTQQAPAVLDAVNNGGVHPSCPEAPSPPPSPPPPSPPPPATPPGWENVCCDTFTAAPATDWSGSTTTTYQCGAYGWILGGYGVLGYNGYVERECSPLPTPCVRLSQKLT